MHPRMDIAFHQEHELFFQEDFSNHLPKFGHGPAEILPLLAHEARAVQDTIRIQDFHRLTHHHTENVGTVDAALLK